ncbi:MAG: hypothetical protein WCI26_08965 [Acidimicrobiales bacterium]
MTTPGTYRESDETEVSAADASAAWVVEARPALERVAAKYQATITYKELAEAVQTASGIRTRKLVQNWVGAVLSAVARDCHAAGEPLLSALCVRADGTVGPGYVASFVELTGDEAPEDPDLHAAEVRLQCYRHFGATMPADGGKATLTPKVAAARARARKLATVALKEESRPICPTCFLMLPVTGQCDNCA